MFAVALLFAATLTGGKGDIFYSVTTKQSGDTLELVIDLSVALEKADPETVKRRALALEDPKITVWLPQEKSARPGMRLWPGTQAGQYRVRYVHSAVGAAVLRIDGMRDDRIFALQLPAQIGDAPVKLATRTLGPVKGEPLLGEKSLGQKAFNQRCACCHGPDAARLMEPKKQLELNEEDWLPAIGLEPVTRGEVAAFLQTLRKPLLPKGTRYLVRYYTLSDEQKTTLRRALGAEATVSDVALYPLFEGVPGLARRIPDTGRELDTATAKTRRGFFALLRESEKDYVVQLDNQLAAVGAAPPAQVLEAVKLCAEAYLAEEADRAAFTP